MRTNGTQQIETEYCQTIGLEKEREPTNRRIVTKNLHWRMKSRIIILFGFENTNHEEIDDCPMYRAAYHFNQGTNR